MRISLILLGAVLVTSGFEAPLVGQTTADWSAPTNAKTGISTQDKRGDSGQVLRRTVSLDLRDVTLDEALTEIDRQARLGLSYAQHVVPVTRKVTLKLHGTAREALERVLSGTGVSPVVTPDGTVVLVKGERRVGADTVRGTIVGRVVDSATAQPVAGVEVFLRNTSHRATTNERGLFSIAQVPAGTYTLMARLLGYVPVTQAVTVADTQVMRVDLVLRTSPTRLTEIVTTATGDRQRLELGNDITVLRVDSIVAIEPVTTVTDLLEGRVPGLLVQRTSGAPGDPARLRLRGTASVYASNDPIVIVDGVRAYSAQSDARNANLATTNLSLGYATPSPLDNIDPHSIETIEVLKGPSAATLYGSDAANGVIVITTKKGKLGPPRWTASVEHGRSHLPGRYPDSYIRWGHRPWDGTPMVCPITNTECVADSLVRFQMLNDPELTVLDRGHRTGVTTSVTGGTEAMTYSLSAGYDEELGIVRLPDYEANRYRELFGTAPPDWMRRPQRLSRWSAASGLTARLGNRATVALTAMLSHSDQQRSSLERELTNLMGTYLDRGSGTYYRAIPAGFVVPVDAALTDYYQRVTAEATQLTNGVSLNWRPREWVTLNADGGLHIVQREDALLLPRGVARTADSLGLASAGRGSSVVSTVNLRATVTAPLPGGFHLRTAVGANYTNQRTTDLSTHARNLPVGGTSVAGAAEIVSVQEQRAEQATFGWYLEPSLAHKRFWLSTGLRFDGGNAFGSGVTLVGLPKLSLSWLISDEPFFPRPLQSVFGTLRLRAAYGHAGVQPGPRDRLRLYSAPTSVWVDGRFVDGVALQTLGNTQVKPERSRELEGGFDADLFDDRFSLSVTGYRKTRIDALMNVPVPPSVYGTNVSILRNVGVIRNTGYEITLDTRLLRSDPATWHAQLSLSHNRNEVVSLGPGVQPFGHPTSYNGRVVPGYPLAGRWGMPVLAYHDHNGDGILQTDEILRSDSLVYLGSSEPDYTAALQTTLSLFRGAVAVSAGFTYQNDFAQRGPWDIYTLRAVARGMHDPTASLDEQVATRSSGAFESTQTVSVLRFNSFAIRYTLPTGVARSVGAKALSVSLQGTNLGLHTNYRGTDPAVNALPTGNGLVDFGTLPHPRTWQVRVHATY